MESRVKPPAGSLADALKQAVTPMTPEAAQEALEVYRAAQVANQWLMPPPNFGPAIPNREWLNPTSGIVHNPPMGTVTREKTLTDFSDAEIIMEMIRRGYAAMKLPADGGVPEVLK